MGNRNGSHMPRFTDAVNNSPMVFPLLQRIAVTLAEADASVAMVYLIDILGAATILTSRPGAAAISFSIGATAWAPMSRALARFWTQPARCR
jgi:hypothetical protein